MSDVADIKKLVSVKEDGRPVFGTQNGVGTGKDDGDVSKAMRGVRRREGRAFRDLLRIEV